MAEKAYTYDRFLHREWARLIQLNDVTHFLDFVVRFQSNPLKSRNKLQNIKNFTTSTLELDCEEKLSSTKPNVAHTFDYVEIFRINLTTSALYLRYGCNTFLPFV